MIKDISDPQTIEDNHVLTKLLRMFNIRFNSRIKWEYVFIMGFFHIVAVYSLFTLESPFKHPKTLVWGLFTSYLAGLGTTAGAHRLWSHKAYKATAPLKLFLLICFCSAGQLTLYKWICDHRIHHKYSETDADPHNAKRGFFFAHVGWVMLDRHPEFLKKEPLIDMSDIYADKFVMFQKKHYIVMNLLFCTFLPTIIPIYFWSEEWRYAILSITFLRFIVILNVTWSVNSVAHLWGNKPYDNRINPAENFFVSLFALGEGWHNYHHSFPWDYKASETGLFSLNTSTFFIELFAKIGWAYDLKEPSKELILATLTNHGDGSHRSVKHKKL